MSNSFFHHVFRYFTSNLGPQGSAPVSQHKRTTSPPAAISESVALEISKTLYQLSFWSRHYNLSLWSDQAHQLKLKHDLELMRQHGDLERVSLELLDSNNKVLHEFRLSYEHKPLPLSKLKDSGEGVEVPVLKPEDHRRVAGHRMLVRRRGRESAYRHQLELNWGSAPALLRGQQQQYESEHASRITGGRLRGQFRIDANAQHLLRITQAGQRGYAFASAVEAQCNLQSVFCHERYARQGVSFQPGSLIRAVVVQTPRGLQARNIEAA